MKKLNFSKGLIVGLLTLALCLACFGLYRASAWTVMLDPNGGSGERTSAKSGADDSSGEYTIEGNKFLFTKEGYVFDGWSESSSGTKTTKTKLSLSGDQTVTLYAVWKEKPAAISGAPVYDPVEDSIVVETDKPGVTVYFAAVKDAAGAELKAGNFKASATTSASAPYTAKISLSDKNSKIKSAENKDSYIVYTLEKPSGTTKKQFTAANIIKVAKTDAKKVTVNFNYVSAISGNPALAISSIEYTPVEGTKYTSVSGDANWAGLIERLQYSTDDGKTWNDVKVTAASVPAANEDEEDDENADDQQIQGETDPNDGQGESAASAESTGFTCGELFALTQKAKAPKVFFRLKGTEGQGSNGTAKRTSKIFKVGVKKAGKAEKALKINAATNSIVIKNGYDFYATDSASGAPSLDNYDGWTTILPVNKDGTATDPFVSTSTYVPYKKPGEDNASKQAFTTKKVKEITLAEFTQKTGVSASSGDVYVFVRKSAGLGKPAGQWTATGFKLAQQVGAPTATTSGETTIIATQGTKGELKGTFSGSGSSLEILVIKKATNTGDIDWSKTKWTKYDASKGITAGKTSSKVTVKDSSEKVTLDENCYVLVRYAGDSKKLILASEYITTQVNKTTSTSGDTYTWVTE